MRCRINMLRLNILHKPVPHCIQHCATIVQALFKFTEIWMGELCMPKQGIFLASEIRTAA
jgi:hypothetical protein